MDRRIKAGLWLIVLASLAVSWFVYLKLDAIDQRLAATHGQSIVSLELAFWPTRAAAIIEGWRSLPADPADPASGRSLLDEARTSIHWDWLFILTYLILMLAVNGLIRRSAQLPPDWAKDVKPWLSRLPWLIILFDTIENLGIYYLLGGDSNGWLFALIAWPTSLLAATKFLLLFAFVVLVYRSKRVNLQVIMLTRFSLLMLLIGVVCIFVPQWQEVLRAVAENQDPNRHLAEWLGFATFVAAIATWYAARTMYMLEIPGRKELSDAATAPLMRCWLPRLLGTAVPIVTALGLFTSVGWNEYLFKPLLALIAALLLFLAFIRWRRLISIPGVRMAKTEDDLGRYRGYLKLPWITKIMLLTLGLLNLLAFVSMLYNPQLAQNVGSAAVVLGAVGLMVPVGTGLVYWGARTRLPLLLLLFAFAGLLSLYNDNHWVRLNPGASSVDATQHPKTLSLFDGQLASLKRYAQTWAKAHANSEKSTQSIPLFVVSAEGGGIRAAYWTALVLASLQERDTRFASHLFAISGVSGGSLGGALFAAQTAHTAPLGNQPCLRRHTDAVLGEDFLAPTLATLLFPDLAQRFLPWPWFQDRAVTLEQSWEAAWSHFTHQDGSFKAPFEQLWPRRNRLHNDPWVPLLFLNSTLVKSGNRLIIHPLGFSEANEGEHFSDLFNDAIDGRAALGSGVPLSTAVHLSARFTYVSPAGTARNHALEPTLDAAWMRMVDGGYFENSGTVTAAEIITALERYRDQAEADSPLSRLRLFVIHISNEPVRPAPQRIVDQPNKQPALGEILSPLFTLLHARPARGFQAREALFTHISGNGSDNHAHFQLHDLGTRLPLGWVLSSAAREDMQHQLGFRLDRESQACSQSLHADDPGYQQVIDHNRALMSRVLGRLPR